MIFLRPRNSVHIFAVLMENNKRMTVQEISNNLQEKYKISLDNNNLYAYLNELKRDKLVKRDDPKNRWPFG